LITRKIWPIALVPGGDGLGQNKPLNKMPTVAINERCVIRILPISPRELDETTEGIDFELHEIEEPST
jgi:hypothetical protein